MTSIFETNKAWPYVEARKIAARTGGGPALLQTGYGPSGLPHIGTFAEVARTTMVRRAYEDLTGAPTQLVVFSDDMDGLRKAPDNVPNRAMLERHLGVSLTRVPDPFGEAPSFAHANNARLRAFLDRFGFDYDFVSATEQYRAGAFDATLRLFAQNYDAIRAIILPTLGEARRATYSPFMPICPRTGEVRESGVVSVDPDRDLLLLDDGSTHSYLRGGAKLQWKADWAMRWVASNVDYEMAGKDLIDSVTLSTRIARAVGHQPPVTMIYEMFLDAEGKKVSKSVGNGLTLDAWLTYGTPESLSAYLYRDPGRAKKLHRALIPTAMDDYWDARGRYATQTPEQQLGNPVHHVHRDQPFAADETVPFTYQLVLNLAQTATPCSADALWGYVARQFPLLDAEGAARVVVDRAFAYYQAFHPSLIRRLPNPEESAALADLADRIAALVPDPEALGVSQEQVQAEVYAVGKAAFGPENLRAWFAALYQMLLGQDSGPRFGAFAMLYGIPETVALLRKISAAAQTDTQTLD